jgi:hypothetical protein
MTARTYITIAPIAANASAFTLTNLVAEQILKEKILNLYINS